MALRINSNIEEQINQAINSLHTIPTGQAASIASDLAQQIETGGITNGTQLGAAINQSAARNRGGLDDYHLGQVISAASQAINPRFNDILSQYQTTAQQAQDEANNQIRTQMNSQMDKLYGTAADQGTAQIERAYAPQRQRAVAEEAALGRLRSGVSADPNSAMGQVDTNKSNALSSLLGNLAGQRANQTASYESNAANLNFEQNRLSKLLDQQNQQMGMNYMLDTQRNILGQKQLEQNADQNSLGNFAARKGISTGFDMLNGQKDSNSNKLLSTML